MRNAIPVLPTSLLLILTFSPVAADAQPAVAGGAASPAASSPPMSTRAGAGTSEPAILVLDAPIDFGDLRGDSAGVGGPEGMAAEDALSSDTGERWRITTESREERRTAPPARAPLNALVIRF
jgi:hypothetical protein